MKNQKLNANRWLKEAKLTLIQAEKILKQNDGYNFACFLAEQASQKALKAVLYFDGARFITIHSIAEMIKEISKNRPDFMDLFNDGALLDQYYLSTRYPDAVAEPAIPSEIFTKNQAGEAVAVARRILEKSQFVIQ